MTTLDKFPFLGRVAVLAEMKANNLNQVGCEEFAIGKHQEILQEAPSDILASGDFPEVCSRFFLISNGTPSQLLDGIPVGEQIRGTTAEILVACRIQYANDFRDYQESLEVYNL